MSSLLGAMLSSFAAVGAAADSDLASAPSRFATLDGARIHYKILGQGEPTLVLVHGWTCNLGFWKGQAGPLATAMRVVAIDLPGHGLSDKPEIVYTMPLFARAVDAVLRDAKIEKAVLAGHSMGTPVVWQFARLFPAKTLALVAVDGSFRAFVTTEEDRQKWASRYKGQDYKTAMATVVDNLIGTIDDAALAREIKTEMLKTPQHVASSAAYEMSDPKVYVTEPKLGVPVLAVYAAAPQWSLGYKKAIEAFIPKLDYQTISGVGHFLMMEKPADFNRRLLTFLRAQGLLRE